MVTVPETAAVLGGIVATATLVKGLVEYSRGLAARRAEMFLDRRAKLKETPILKELCDLIEVDDPKLREFALKEKLHLTGFFEEIALLVNSAILRTHVAHYMFGYYALRCWESNNFWYGLNRDAKYWALLRDFVVQMKERENNFTYSRANFRL
jgi:hypothetical protein